MPLNPQDCSNILALARLGLSKMGETDTPDRMVAAWQCWGQVSAGFSEMFAPASAEKKAEPTTAPEPESNGTVDTDGPAQL